MANYSEPDDLMVVSAAGCTTNQLINWVKLRQSDRLGADQAQAALHRYQSSLICDLLREVLACLFYTAEGAVEGFLGLMSSKASTLAQFYPVNQLIRCTARCGHHHQIILTLINISEPTRPTPMSYDLVS